MLHPLFRAETGAKSGKIPIFARNPPLVVGFRFWGAISGRYSDFGRDEAPHTQIHAMSSKLAPKSRQNRVQKKFGTHISAKTGKAMLSGANTRLRPACSRDLSPEGSITGHLPPVSPFWGRVGPKSEKCTENLCQLAVQLTKIHTHPARPCANCSASRSAFTVGGNPQLLPSGSGLLKPRRETSTASSMNPGFSGVREAVKFGLGVAF